ncbi:MAG: dTMP kinase [Desulfobacterales bacterium]|nr:dTMP kinase [Desulfobacterales bacterium]
MTLGKGLLVVFEGIDGVGKTTQIRLLHDALKKKGLDVVLSREPTDGVHGREIRRLAMEGRDAVTPEEEYGLFLKDRREHVETLIRPAMDAGGIVVLDRYYFSSVAYQGAIGLDPEKIRAENEAFCPIPDAVFLFEAPPKLGLQRIREKRGEAPDLFEKEEYLERVARVYSALTESYIHRIDATGSVEAMHGKIMRGMRDLLDRG